MFLMIFIASLFFTHPNKKKLKSTFKKNSEDYLSNNKNTNSIFFFELYSIAEINYEIFSIRPKAYSYLISVQHYYFLIIYVISTKSEFLFGIYDEYLSCFI
jgi:hypothetical protein